METALLAVFAAIVLLYPTASQNIVKEQGDSELRIKFIRYENRDGKLADGFFCEADFNGKKMADCDPIFKFEVMREGGNGDLLFRYRQSDHISAGTVFHFRTVIGSMVNPISFEVEMENPRHIFLEVTVDDYDPSGKNKPMDIFVYMLQTTLKAQNVTLISPTTKHSLLINYRFTCKTNFYGSLCEKYCVGMNDDTNGHFGCSPEGEKVCLEGWTNVESDCKVPAWCIWC